ncbi:MAG: extracellular solute-binding protein [Alcanivorax sp.]|nr:extracellular solute-binding protein [Alcanivorax sp.]
MRTARRITRMLLPGLVALVAGCGSSSSAPELLVYTSRHDELVAPVFAAYTRATGIHIRYVTDSAGALIERLQAEGGSSPADLLLTADAGNLWRAARAGVLAPLDSVVLNANVPARLRDPRGRWFALSRRARTLVYNTQRVDPANLSSYAALADPRWKGRLCLRTSHNIYNRSLVATMIKHLGPGKTSQVLRGWVANLATNVFSNDTALMEAMVAGQCDVGIVNTYYYGVMKRNNPQLPLALFWANQQSSGVHINIAGGGLTRHAPHRRLARKLLEWLSQAEGQQLLANANLEFPVNPAVEPADEEKGWGRFRADALPVKVAGELHHKAVMLMQQAGYQ